jgi:hypothetical protein
MLVVMPLPWYEKANIAFCMQGEELPTKDPCNNVWPKTKEGNRKPHAVTETSQMWLGPILCDKILTLNETRSRKE